MLSLCHYRSMIQELKKRDFQEALANLEQNITNSINSVKTEEINNLKDVIIKRLKDKYVILRDRCSKLEHIHKKRKDSLETRAEPAIFSL